jgi:hypothetical protein
MSDLLLDEERVVARLDQMGDVRVAEAVHAKFLRQSDNDSVSPLSEAVADRLVADAGGALARPDGRPFGGRREDVPIGVDPFVHDPHRPRENGEDAAPLRRASLVCLAPANVEHAPVAELGSVGIGAEVLEVKHHDFTPAQPPGVRSLEDGGVPEQRQPGLARPLPGLGHPIVRVVEERLELHLGQRPQRWVALLLCGMDGGVPFEADLGGMGSEHSFAYVVPEIPWVGDVLEEEADVPLVAADRRQGRRLGAASHLRRELLEVQGPPGPGVLIGEALETSERQLTVPDCLAVEVPAELLVAPAVDHRFEDLVLGAEQRRRPLEKRAGCRTRNQPWSSHRDLLIVADTTQESCI